MYPIFLKGVDAYRQVIIELKHVISEHIANYLPQKIRKILFLSSVVAMIENENSTEELAQQLNRILKLTVKNKAIEFPMIIKNVIWKEKLRKFNETSLIQEKNQNQIVDLFCNNAPRYLVYGNPEKMRDDLTYLFSALKIENIK